MKVIFIKDAELITRKSRSSIVIHKGDGNYREINVRDIEAVVFLGSRIKIESGVITLLSSYNIPVSIANKLGVSILTTPVVTLSSDTRRAQYSLSEDEKTEIMLAILMAKFRGFANILKYHGVAVTGIELDEEQAKHDLLRWEAGISRIFWQSLLGLIPSNLLEELKKYGFQGRKPGAKDPFNQSVSALYATLYSLATRALLANGLDPTYGLHHRTRYSTPLVFDYTEMFKPIAVHATIKLLRRMGRLPELEKDGYLTKDSLNILLKEFYSIMKAKIQRTRITPHRAVYVHAFKLATRIRTHDKNIKYTYVYNPKKIIVK